MPDVIEKWAAVIPAYNAGRTIGEVLRGVMLHIPSSQILMVDDGSEDATAGVARSLSVNVLSLGKNCGKGSALRAGFAQVLMNPPAWIVCLDADGQHDPDIIPSFATAAESEQFDLLIGDRRADHREMPILRRLSNRLSSALLSARTGWDLSDAQCGYRAIRLEALRAMNLKAERYEIEAEMILEARRLNLRLGWVPIPTIYRGERSFLRKAPETLRFLKLLARSH